MNKPQSPTTNKGGPKKNGNNTEKFFTKLTNENKILKGELADLRQSIEKMGKFFNSSRSDESDNSPNHNENTSKKSPRPVSPKFEIVTMKHANIEEVTSAPPTQEHVCGTFQCFNEDFHIGTPADYMAMFEYFDSLCSLVPMEESTKYSFGRKESPEMKLKGGNPQVSSKPDQRPLKETPREKVSKEPSKDSKTQTKDWNERRKSKGTEKEVRR